MISLTLLLCLSLGTAAMLVPIIIQAKWYGIKMWKSIPIVVCLTVVGTIGTYLLFFIENRWIGGTSFYGAVFFVPIVFPLLAKVLHESKEDLLDLCAPAECIMLVIMKVQCQINGCCKGREITLPWSQMHIQFPSQIAELINALVLMVVLLAIARSKKNQGSVFPWYMVIYGVTRFVLNCFREENIPYALGLPAGSFWSLVSIIIGAAWLYYRKHHKQNEVNVI